ncbi:MAG: hypothetical protein IKE28_06315 [Solobacterium sp.]|nr:hypothetical protein [Solobacterium sp.]
METVKIRLTDQELDQIIGGVTVEKIIPMNGIQTLVWMSKGDAVNIPDYNRPGKGTNTGKDVPGHNDDILPGNPTR